MVDEQINEELDTIGLFCPEPLFQTRDNLNKMEVGQVLQVFADDPASEEDLKRFCKRTGHQLIDFKENDGIFQFLIKKTK